MPSQKSVLSEFPRLSFVVGGARSGKSRFAEALVKSAGGNRCYIATAQSYDDEMEQRIRQHQLDRGPDWDTIEAPMDLSGAILNVPHGSVTLIDCATLWLSNHLLAESDLAAEAELLLQSLSKAENPVVIVSNEVGMGIVPENRLARQFRDAQGRLNQKLAAQADLVVTVIAGLPLVLKGQMPGGLL